MSTVKKHIIQQPDGSYVLVSAVAPTYSRPMGWGLGRLVHFFDGLDVLCGYMNVHVPLLGRLRWRGYAYAVVFLPWGWRLRVFWFVYNRWPKWEWEHFAGQGH